MRQEVTPIEYYSRQLGLTFKRTRGWANAGLCPFHKDTSTGSFYVNLSTGGFNCFSCGAKGKNILSFHQRYKRCSFLDAFNELRNSPSIPSINAKSESTPEKKRRNIQRIIDELVPLDTVIAKPARLYLKKRGLDVSNLGSIKDLYFHPHLEYFDQGVYYYPALVAKVRSLNGEIATLHRTYLTYSGAKAPVTAPRKLMPSPNPIRGCAIRLFPAKSFIALAEGIESALAVHILTGLPVWATLSANGLKNIELPLEVQKVIICADNDANNAGLLAANEAAKRLQHYNVRCKIVMPQSLVPDTKSYDFLDLLLSEQT